MSSSAVMLSPIVSSSPYPPLLYWFLLHLFLLPLLITHHRYQALIPGTND